MRHRGGGVSQLIWWDESEHAYNLAFSTCLDAFRSMKGTIRCRVDEQDNREPFAQCCGTDLNCKRTHQADAGAAWGPTVNIRFPPMTPTEPPLMWKQQIRKQIADLCEESLLWPTAPEKNTPNIWWNEATICLLSFESINNWAGNGRPLTKSQSPTHSSDTR